MASPIIAQIKQQFVEMYDDCTKKQAIGHVFSQEELKSYSFKIKVLFGILFSTYEFFCLKCFRHKNNDLLYAVMNGPRFIVCPVCLSNCNRLLTKEEKELIKEQDLIKEKDLIRDQPTDTPKQVDDAIPLIAVERAPSNLRWNDDKEWHDAIPLVPVKQYFYSYLTHNAENLISAQSSDPVLSIQMSYKSNETSIPI
jgi:hypothetical protein